jgi:hypothetical protein
MRHRVDELAESWSEATQRLDERYRRVAMILMATALAIVVASVSGYVLLRHQRLALARESENTNAALCTLRGDLERRVQGAKAFLTEHPLGIPGIPRATLQQNIRNQQKTIGSLSRLECRR